MSDAGLTISEAERAAPVPADETRNALARLERIADPETGIITGIRRVPVPPDEPAIESYVVDREDFAPLTDGTAMPHEEGGCGFERDEALVATYGEAVERYCGCLYRQASFRTASYADLAEPALDPSAVVNFSASQRATMSSVDSLCGVDDELSWVAGTNLATGTTTHVPAQLVYLSYPPNAEPFLRNPISSGLAAGSTRAMAIRNGLCELIERDAFMIYYLTETELPTVDLATAPPRLRRVADRVTAHGLDLTVLDATTDHGVPVAIAVLVDRRSRPAVTVAAAGGADAAAVIESALEEAVQTRLWGIHNIDELGSPADLDPSEITSFRDRGLFWAAPERIADLGFWIESSRETTFDEFAATGLTDEADDRSGGPDDSTGESDDAPDESVVDRVTAAGYDCYGVDVTTRDVAALGFTVQRVVAPGLQPLYLLERLRYFGGDRLSEVPVEMGYRETPPTEASLTTVPHPFP